MKILGVIAEYNPFHLGHQYHLDQAKKLVQPDYTILVMSNHFVQRGMPAGWSKFKRTQIALDQGIDMVLSLPTLFSLQEASIFARKSIEILDQARVTDLVFGSESNNLQDLKEISELSINPSYLKATLKTGASYASSLSDRRFGPNDILGICYLRALANTKIQPHTIKRTSSYLDASLDQDHYWSASAIRRHPNHPEAKKQSLLDLSTPLDEDKLFSLIQYSLIHQTPNSLKKIMLVDEGIENLLVKAIDKATSLEDLIQRCVSKRYNQSRIQRTLMAILLSISKETNQVLSNMTVPLTLLGFRKEAQPLLSYLKSSGVILRSQVSQQVRPFFELEKKATQVYQLFSKEKNLLEQEISLPIIHPSD